MHLKYPGPVSSPGLLSSIFPVLLHPEFPSGCTLCVAGGGAGDATVVDDGLIFIPRLDKNERLLSQSMCNF